MFTLGCGRFKSGIEPRFASLLRNELYGVIDLDRSIVIDSFGVFIFVMTVRTCKCRFLELYVLARLKCCLTDEDSFGL